MGDTDFKQYDPVGIDELRQEATSYINSLETGRISQVELNSLGTQFQAALENANEEGVVGIELQGGRILDSFAKIIDQYFAKEDTYSGFDTAGMLLASDILVTEQVRVQLMQTMRSMIVDKTVEKIKRGLSRLDYTPLWMFMDEAERYGFVECKVKDNNDAEVLLDIKRVDIFFDSSRIILGEILASKDFAKAHRFIDTLLEYGVIDSQQRSKLTEDISKERKRARMDKELS